jgi:hypothetical protein
MAATSITFRLYYMFFKREEMLNGHLHARALLASKAGGERGYCSK